MTEPGQWQFWIDRGGTFTDVVALSPQGALITKKLLSEDPQHYGDAAVAGIRACLGLDGKAPIASERIHSVKMGTTVATNALLTRRGEPTLLVVTRGFRDALRIGYQERPRIFDRHIVLPEAVYAQVIEADERVSAQGAVIRALDEAALRDELQRAYQQGLRAAAIVFMHGYRYPVHEQRAGELARHIGFTQISLSHAVSPLMKFVSRGDTTVVDAYLSPVLRRYVDSVQRELPGVRVMFMQSNGSLADARYFQGKDSILSGPAGGVVGGAGVAQQAGFSRVIGFDMGGTSTDVWHYSGAFEYQYETQVAGVRMRRPMMAIHTVAAGGGSLVHLERGRLRVGPDSAGATPGPACYRQGGPLTVTDCNVLLGRIQPEFFPKVFGLNADQPIDAGIVARKFAALAAQVQHDTGQNYRPMQLAEGFLQVAVGNMANAIKKISIAKGHDVATYVLCCFGGAAGQHACAVADALGVERILIHPLAGVLSAYGIGMAQQSVQRELAVEATLDDALLARLAQEFAQLSRQARAQLETQGAPAAFEHRHVHVRYAGTDSALVVEFAARSEIEARFAQQYRQRFSFLMPGRALVVESISVEVTTQPTEPNRAISTVASAGAATPATTVNMVSEGASRPTPLYQRESLASGHRIAGPAIIVDASATTVIEPGWQALVTERGDLLLTRVRPRATQRQSTELDPIRLEIFNNLFMAIAEEMGVRLQQSAYSVNIKERLDFSCAVFDALGNLIANAPHMPVHLGSMGESVRAVIRTNAGRMQPGDSYMLNDPYHGGTHLPDVTVITPVFDRTNTQILFYVGSRGHHAEIGGITPGSMPPDSRHVEEEGVLIDNFKLVAADEFLEAQARALLTSGKYPSRNVEQNVADLRAQVAANAKGVHDLLQMVDDYGLEVVHAYMQHVQDNAEESVRRVISALKHGSFSYPMDNGAVIKVAIRVDHAARSAVVDFTGTSAQLDNNFNAPRAVTMAAVLYVFRTLVDADIPMNEGCLKPLQVIVPEGCMLSPRYPAAVVAGNVETSQCVVNALYGALGVLAAGCGTMSNFTFGNERYQYYETVSGGSGAGPDFDGTDVVQTHMTNSRLTDPEVLEWRFPVRLESYEIRAGSGGNGKHHGGNGGTRKVRFLEPMTAAILSGHRKVPPFGVAGGCPGEPGRNYVERLDGSMVDLGPTGAIEMQAGEVFVVETPGGGGYGASDK